MGIPLKVKGAIDLVLPSYAVALIILFFYILLHYTVKKKMATGNSLQTKVHPVRRTSITEMQRSFVHLSVVLLIVLRVCFVPTTVMTAITLLLEDNLDLPQVDLFEARRSKRECKIIGKDFKKV